MKTGALPGRLLSASFRERGKCESHPRPSVPTGHGMTAVVPGRVHWCHASVRASRGAQWSADGGFARLALGFGVTAAAAGGGGGVTGRMTFRDTALTSSRKTDCRFLPVGGDGGGGGAGVVLMVEDESGLFMSIDFPARLMMESVAQ